jgi:hypothetical protein
MRLIEHTARWVDLETFRLLPIWYPEHARGAHFYKKNWSEPQMNTNRETGHSEHKREANRYANVALGIHGDFERRDERSAAGRQGKFLEIEFRGLAQVGQRLLDRFAWEVVPVSGLFAVYAPSGASMRTAVINMIVSPLGFPLSRESGQSPRPTDTLEWPACVAALRKSSIAG